MSNPTIKFFGLVPTRYKPAVATALLGLAAVHVVNSGYRDWNAGADTAYVLGLLLLFFSRETVEDERVQELKLKALTVGFFTGWAIVGAVRFGTYLRDRQIAPRTMSAYDAMLVMLAIAHGLFIWWRWRDGRDASDGPPDRLQEK